MTAKLKPIIKVSAEAQSTESLRSHILSGHIAPGSRLKEVQLAEEMQIARATLRTSLLRLRDEGIVVQIPYTGWHVVQLSPKDAWELWTLRGSLESLATKLVAERMDSELEARIEAAFADLKRACDSGDVMATNEADFALHRTIVESSDHRRLIGQYKQVEQQVRLYIANHNALTPSNLRPIYASHEPLIDALLARDVTRATQEAWRHNESVGGELVAALRKAQRDKD